jgi:hypothetical protein
MILNLDPTTQDYIAPDAPVWLFASLHQRTKQTSGFPLLAHSGFPLTLLMYLQRYAASFDCKSILHQTHRSDSLIIAVFRSWIIAVFRSLIIAVFRSLCLCTCNDMLLNKVFLIFVSLICHVGSRTNYQGSNSLAGASLHR